MILDTMEHSEQYRDSYPAIYRALKAIGRYTAEQFPSGRVEVDGDNLFLFSNQYTTHNPKGAFSEAHQKYIDVMYMLSGTEAIYVTPVDQLQTITKEYSSEKDILLAETSKNASAIYLHPGSFIVLFPQDAHAPGCYGPDGPEEVIKIVAKVRIE